MVKAMAKRTYYCKPCESIVQKIVDDIDALILCQKCLVAMIIKPPEVSTVVKEVIDNGFQVRRVEQIADAGDLFKEHADKHNKKKNDDEL